MRTATTADIALNGVHISVTVLGMVVTAITFKLPFLHRGHNIADGNVLPMRA